MAKTNPETTLLNKIQAQLNGYTGLKYIKTHGSANTSTGEPDLIGSYCGKAFAIEVKTGSNKLTKIQKMRLKEWRDAGAYVGVARSVEDAIDVIHGLGPNKEEWKYS